MQFDLEKKLEPFKEYAPLLIRITFGFHLLYYSWQPVITLSADESAPFLSSLGIPFPVLMSWLYVLTEFIGGILLMVGFKVRWMALPLIITFIVAAFVAHGGDPYEKSFQALQLLAVSIYFLLRGSGKFSLDSILTNHKS